MPQASFWDSLKQTIAPFAPTLASALGGPLAGAATKFILDKIGANEGGNEQAVQQQIMSMLGDTKGLQQLRQIENEFKQEMEKMNVDVFALEVDDRKSARELAKQNNKPHILISAIFITAYFIILIAVFYAEISPDYNPGSVLNKDNEWVSDGTSLLDLMHVLLGVLTAGVGQILSFWFGGVMKRENK